MALFKCAKVPTKRNSKMSGCGEKGQSGRKREGGEKSEKYTFCRKVAQYEVKF